MQTKYLLTLFLLFFFACKTQEKIEENELKFNKEKWEFITGDKYPYRKKMINDLIINYTLKGLKTDELGHLIGQPNRIDGSYLFYTIDQELLAGIFPLHTKTLVIKLGKDSTVAWRKIHE